MLKNRLCLILLLFALTSLPIFAEPEMPTIEQPAEEQVLNLGKGVSSSSETEELVPQSLPEDVLLSDNYKEPVNKRKIIKKFLFAMLGVAASSLIIYIGLSVYNKIRRGFVAVQDSVSPESDTSLVTPETLSEAVGTFINKTKWM